MRLVLGMVLGVCLTVGAAYLFDTATVGSPTSAQDVTTPRPMVNWDVVGNNWHGFTDGVRHAWNRLAKPSPRA